MVRGTVVNGQTGRPIMAVSVQNTNTGGYAYTGAGGNFEVQARVGDRLSFFYTGYRTQFRVVSTTTADYYIELFPLSFELDEFVYRPLYTPYQLDSMERKSTYQRALAREKSGSVMSPVTLLAEKLSKRSKQIFRFQKSFEYWEGVKFVESRYAPELVQQLTGLVGDSLAHFINANPMPYDYARVASELELKMWIRERYRAWQKEGAGAGHGSDPDTLTRQPGHKE